MKKQIKTKLTEYIFIDCSKKGYGHPNEQRIVQARSIEKAVEYFLDSYNNTYIKNIDYSKKDDAAIITLYKAGTLDNTKPEMFLIRPKNENDNKLFIYPSEFEGIKDAWVHTKPYKSFYKTTTGSNTNPSWSPDKTTPMIDSPLKAFGFKIIASTHIPKDQIYII